MRHWICDSFCVSSCDTFFFQRSISKNNFRNLINSYIQLVSDKHWYGLYSGVNIQTGGASTFFTHHIFFLHIFHYFSISSISKTDARILMEIQIQLDVDIPYCWLGFNVNRPVDWIFPIFEIAKKINIKVFRFRFPFFTNWF